MKRAIYKNHKKARRHHKKRADFLAILRAFGGMTIGF